MQNDITTCLDSALAIAKESNLLKKEFLVMVDKWPWKEIFIPGSCGVKHVTTAIVQQLKNNSDLHRHLYTGATGTQTRTRGLFPLHHTLYWRCTVCKAEFSECYLQIASRVLALHRSDVFTVSRGETYNSVNEPCFLCKKTESKQQNKCSHNVDPKFKQPLNWDDYGKEILKEGISRYVTGIKSHVFWHGLIQWF